MFPIHACDWADSIRLRVLDSGITVGTHLFIHGILIEEARQRVGNEIHRENHLEER